MKSGIPQSARSTRKKELQIRRKVLVRTSQVEEQPSQRCKRNGDKSAVALLKRDKELGLCTIPPETNSNDFGGFWN